MKKETLQYRIDNRLCTRCGEPAVLKRKMCEKHLIETRFKEGKKREKRKNKNVCIRCGQKPPRQGKTQCDFCANDNKDKYNAVKMDIYYQRRSAGQCVRCGVDTIGFAVHCDICAKYMKQKDKIRYDQSKNDGLCAHCHKLPPINKETLCLDCKMNNAARGKETRNKQKFIVIDHYGGKCEYCGEKDLDVLCIDHIDGSGGQHRKKLAKDGTTTYRWLVKNNYPVGFQVLCFNCNMKKHLNGGKCPHKL